MEVVAVIHSSGTMVMTHFMVVMEMISYKGVMGEIEHYSVFKIIRLI